MRKTLPGEIWRVDFGLAAKVRPALILSDFPADNELALLVVIPHDRYSRQSMGIEDTQTFSSEWRFPSSTNSTNFFGAF